MSEPNIVDGSNYDTGERLDDEDATGDNYAREGASIEEDAAGSNYDTGEPLRDEDLTGENYAPEDTAA